MKAVLSVEPNLIPFVLQGSFHQKTSIAKATSIDYAECAKLKK